MSKEQDPVMISISTSGSGEDIKEFLAILDDLQGQGVVQGTTYTIIPPLNDGRNANM